MVSFTAILPPIFAFSTPSRVQFELTEETLDLTGDNWRESVPLKLICRVRAAAFNPRLPVFLLPYVPATHYELRIWRRDRRGAAVFQAEPAEHANYTRFMTAFVPALQKQVPDAVFETGTHRATEVLWGVVGVIAWLTLMMAIGTKLLRRVMTTDLKQILWGITIVGIVAIIALTVYALRRRPSGPEAILNNELPPPSQAD